MLVQELKSLMDSSKEWGKNEVLIDVREPDEFAQGRVPHAINTPLDNLSSKLHLIENYGAIYVICKAGGRSASACEALTRIFGPKKKIINIEGGTLAWERAGFPISQG